MDIFWTHFRIFDSLVKSALWAFDNYVDKIRGVKNGKILSTLLNAPLRSIWMVPNAAAAAVAVAATLAASTSWLSEDMEAILVSDSLLCEAMPKGALVRTP